MRQQYQECLKEEIGHTVASSPGAAVVLMQDDYLFDIGQAGQFEVVAMFVGHGMGKDQWRGRTVSKPVVVHIPESGARK